MGKRGQAAEVLFAVVVILLTIAGTVITLHQGSKIYIGDQQSKLIYEYSLCTAQVERIPEERKVVFESLNPALKLNYRPQEGCIS